MRFTCDSCGAQYMISDDKVRAKGAKVRCKKCHQVIVVRPVAVATPEAEVAPASAQAPSSSRFSVGEGGEGGAAVKPPTGAQILSGVDDEEIGAVFDQALAESAEELNKPINGAPGPSEALKDLASEEAVSPREAPSSPSGAPFSPSEVEGPPPAETKSEDWFVAIDEKQVGPLNLEKLKAFWDGGQIGPDTLCWRAGFSDWTALSGIYELSSLLAPRPSKPVIIAAPTTQPSMPAAPVESVLTGSFSPKTPAATPTAPAPQEEGTGWRPSAASTLASLMKEEIESLAPTSPAAKAPESVAAAARAGRAEERSLVDVPSGPIPVPIHHPVSTGPAYYGPVGPPRRRGWVVPLAVGFGSLAVVVAAVLATYVLTRSPPSPLTVSKPPTQTVTEVPKPPPSQAPQQKPETGTNSPPVKAEAQPGAKPPEVASAEKNAPLPDARKERTSRRKLKGSSREEGTAAASPRKGEGEVITPRGASPRNPVADDDFEKVFGEKQGQRSSAPKAEAKKEKLVYVPPAPGSADIPESLGQSDVMQVVVANKPAILNCVQEQKRRDSSHPSGRIVMRWIIHTNGSVSNVSCQSEDFKGTYVASCIASLIKSWSFPRHKVQGEPINFPFTF